MSLSRPGGNITGVTSLNSELLPKRVEMLRELLPNIAAIGLLANPNNPNTKPAVQQAQALAQAGGWRLHVVEVRSGSDIDAAFATLVQQRVGAFLMVNDGAITARAPQIAALAARHALPSIFQSRAGVEAGGLMSYGGYATETNRIAGLYTGRILKGDKPADLPVQQITRVELVINMKTAKALGLTFPLTLLGRADEVIE